MGTIVSGHPWMEFLYFFNPVAYGLRCVTLNEFVSSKYELYAGNASTPTLQALTSTSVLIPPSQSAANYYTNSVCQANPALNCDSRSLGENILTFMSVSSKMPWKWGGIGYLFFQLFNFLGSAAMALDLYGMFTVLNVGTSRSKGDDDEVHTSVELEERHSVLPFTPMSVAWRALRYTVKLADGTSRTLLNGISGVAQPGRFVALMGASGAGKTTLLDVLAGRKTAGVMEGEIFLNGRPRDGTSFSRMTAYCEQTDVHNSFATVREALHFSAFLRLSSDIDAATRNSFVEEVISLLELGEIADRMIGESGSVDGLAPGQRKIVTIAVELCANTPILFLDVRHIQCLAGRLTPAPRSLRPALMRARRRWSSARFARLQTRAGPSSPPSTSRTATSSSPSTTWRCCRRAAGWPTSAPSASTGAQWWTMCRRSRARTPARAT